MPKVLLADRDAVLARGEIPVDWYNPWPDSRLYGLHFIPLARLQAGPRHGRVDVLENRWWAVHPALGALLFGPTPQANVDRVLTTKLVRGHYPGAHVMFIRRALVPVNPHH